MVEDTSTSLTEIKTLFGKRIAALVAADSEDKMLNMPPSESWELRKRATVDALQSASTDEKFIVLSDKLSNIRSIHQDMTIRGDDIWERFNQKDKKKHEWYYRKIATTISELSEHTAYQEFCRLET